MATPNIKFPTLKFPNLTFPAAQIPGIDLTNFDVKKNIETTRENTKRAVEMATNLTKDIAYVTVGSGVLAFQQVQVRRREVTAAVQSRIPSSFGDVTAAGAAVSARVSSIAKSAKDAAEHVVGRVIDSASKSVSETVVSVRSKIAPSA
ncbi:MAG: hypothetical protein RIQ64_1104 [Actinomycetota bacterium]|jgi:septation ring formation regulator EzrA